MIPRPQGSPRFPYTTLFRSSPCQVGKARMLIQRAVARETGLFQDAPRRVMIGMTLRVQVTHAERRREPHDRADRLGRESLPPRSEEHTSELQSQSNLVCRLL